MKKILYTGVACMLLLAGQSKAQTLTAANCNPVIGESFTIYPTNYLSPGNAGANQLWNLSSLTPSATGGTLSILSATSVPATVNFTNASFVANNPSLNSTDVYSVNTNGIDYSYRFSGASQFYYTDTKILLKYPCSLGSSFTDTWAYNFYLIGFPTITNKCGGTMTVTADGTGTLITPAGVFNNVIRLHSSETFTLGTPVTFNPEYNITVDTYRWYLPGLHTEVLSLFFRSEKLITTSQTNTIQGGSMYVSPGNPLSLSAQTKNQFSVELYPNPARNLVSFKRNGLEYMDADITISDMNGRVLLQKVHEQGTSEIDVSGLNEGMYFVIIREKNKFQEVKKLVISR